MQLDASVFMQQCCSVSSAEEERLAEGKEKKEGVA